VNKLFASIQNSGLHFANSPAERRGILLSNQINLILFSLGLLLSVFYWIYYPPNVIRYIIPCIGVLGLVFIILNAIGQNILSRIGTSLFVPFATMALSIYSKGLYYDTQVDLDYFTFRFIILGSSILPAILFTTRERALLISGLLVNLLLLLSHDFLHSLFGVGYRYNGIDPGSYYFVNIVIAVTYFMLLCSILFLKINLERADRKNSALIKHEQLINNELKNKNDEIEAQHHELLTQSERLSQNQDELLKAYELIEKQKELLSHENRHLETELLGRNQDLSEANSELIKYNNELRQFSYTISHNLRGPVASLLGLVELYDRSTLSGENNTVTNHISSSAQRLDAIIQDLNKIIDIRNDIFQIRQKVVLADELKQIKKVLHLGTDVSFVTLQTDLLKCEQIYSVRPMVHSILYNLISNAIKYRAPERLSEIRVSTNETPEYYILQVEDNGLGIDLNTHRENLFKLYKRFHYHTEGKGIGLYLVKLQCEALGGHVEVQSELNKFTRFTAYLRKPENIERQLLFEQPHAQIFFDASINSTGIVWHGPVTSQQYRDVFVKSLEFVKAFSTPNYIADISYQGPISEEDQQWMFRSIIPEAAQFGLRRIASIKPNSNTEVVRTYLKGINQNLLKHKITYEMFESMDGATDWMRSANEQEIIKLSDGKYS
jgi:signal transduction histidine kinase